METFVVKPHLNLVPWRAERIQELDQTTILMQFRLKLFSTVFLLLVFLWVIFLCGGGDLGTIPAWKSWILMSLNCWASWPVRWIRTIKSNCYLDFGTGWGSTHWSPPCVVLRGSHRGTCREDNLQLCSLWWNPRVEKLREAPKVQRLLPCLWTEGLSFTAITRYEFTAVISFVLYHHGLLAWCLQIFDKGDSLLPDILPLSNIYIRTPKCLSWNSCPEVAVKYLR